MTFLKRKINLFGKEVSLLLVTILAITLVSAAVVPYLSNTLIGTTKVSSPMQCWSDGYGGASSTLNLPAKIFANGDSFSYPTYCKSLTNSKNVYGIMIKITAPAGTTWAGEEFREVNLSDGTVSGSILPYLCAIKDSDGTMVPFSQISTLGTNVAKIVFSHNGDCVVSPQVKFDYALNTEIFNQITITPGPIKSGDYTISMCYVSKLKGADCE